MTRDEFAWVDPGVCPEQKLLFQNLEIELCRVRSDLLLATATLRLCKESENFFKGQVVEATHGEVLWMALFMVAILMQTAILSKWGYGLQEY